MFSSGKRKAKNEKFESSKTFQGVATPISVESGSTNADTIISPKSGFTSSTGSSSPALNMQVTPAATVESSIESQDTKNFPVSAEPTSEPKSPSLKSYCSFHLGHSFAPPFQNSFDEILQYTYTNERGPLIRHLEESIDNVFTCLTNIYFLGLQSAENGTREEGLYSIIANWMIQTDAVRKVWAHENWHESRISVVFLKTLILELHDTQRSINTRSYSSKNSTKNFQDFIQETEILLAVLKWSRLKKPVEENPVTRQRSDSFKITEMWLLEDLLRMVDFTVIPQNDLLDLLEKHVADSGKGFKITQDTMTTVIRVAWSNYEPVSSAPKKPKWLSNILQRISMSFQ
ncbi:hypothetical protein MP638_006505 [Amoeboaphelidium occidentale]|nr:hypothetical protein MP638_006505 [Amoeboaphelidium occidentale]